MAALPAEVTSPTVDAIYKAYEDAREDWRRPHLGASLIGDDCERSLWMTFRWVSAPEHPGRILRLFETGELEEARMVADLRATGAEVHDRDEDGNQFRVAADPHVGGSMDAVAIKLIEAPKSWHVCEFKTHNSKSFADLKKNGVAKSKPRHYAQMQIYMLLTGIDRALYLAKNKDTEELYQERIKFDRAFAERMVAKGQRVVYAARPASRISEDPAWYICKFCDHHAVCHEGAAPEKNCRTCAHSTPLPEGGWRCEELGRPIDTDWQKLKDCSWYHVHPDLVKA